MVLKAGARLVIADGFLACEPLRWPLSVLMRALCKNWAVPRFANLGAFCDALSAHGFELLEVRDISYRVAPSALHVPWVTLRFVWYSLFEKVSRLRWWARRLSSDRPRECTISRNRAARGSSNSRER